MRIGRRIVARDVVKRCDDAGAAVVEFVMISVLLLILLFSVLQVAAVLYVRNVVAASVSDAAHYMALRGVGPEQGSARAKLLIGQAFSGLGSSFRCDSSLGTDVASGLTITRVECQGRIKSIFVPAGQFVNIDVVAHALKEPE